MTVCTINIISSNNIGSIMLISERELYNKQPSLA